MGINCTIFKQMGLICFPVLHTPDILEIKKYNTTLPFQGPQQTAPSVLTPRWINYLLMAQ